HARPEPGESVGVLHADRPADLEQTGDDEQHPGHDGHLRDTKGNGGASSLPSPGTARLVGSQRPTTGPSHPSQETTRGAGDDGHRPLLPENRRCLHLQVQAGRVLGPLEPVRGHGVQIALTHQHIRDPPHLDLGAVLRVEQHPVTRLHGPYVLPHRDDLGPGQPPAHRRRGGDEDAAPRTPLALVGVLPHEYAVVQHPDGQLVVLRTVLVSVGAHAVKPTCLRRDPTRAGQPLRRRVPRASSPTTPTTRTATGTTRSRRGEPSASTNFAFTSLTTRLTPT